MSVKRWAATAMAAMVAAVSLTACGGGDSGSGGDAMIRVWGSEPQKPLVPTMNNETGGHDILK